MRRGRNHSIAGAFALVLLGAFAVSSALLALFGAQAYRAVVARSEERRARRTLVAMVRNAVNASDAQGALSVESLDGVEALCFTSEAGGEEYIRYLYVYDGALRELFISAERPFDPAAGGALCAAESMTAGREGGAMVVELTDSSGAVYEVVLAPRAAGQG
ncbi:MAG TPA: DUF4860 domain-containing protein [Candidatus Alectryocaccomicrobium excrementavium]|uniref:DUF4860 domain-containing protein n=1 Tax=Candidatus Alectryocaccomicrobium excrementavium TaxID=2840668 RepID=A0A9D1FYU0_9FIRM|nr:DUF4860 domain-containing protein [Candidatus Alectryocaccomicrobium excrementavium]